MNNIYKSNKTAETSVIPVKTDKKPEIESTLKLPDKDQNKKLSVLVGGEPFAGSVCFIQLKSFIDIA